LRPAHGRSAPAQHLGHVVEQLFLLGTGELLGQGGQLDGQSLRGGRGRGGHHMLPARTSQVRIGSGAHPRASAKSSK